MRWCKTIRTLWLNADMSFMSVSVHWTAQAQAQSWILSTDWDHTLQRRTKATASPLCQASSLKAGSGRVPVGRNLCVHHHHHHHLGFCYQLPLASYSFLVIRIFDGDWLLHWIALDCFGSCWTAKSSPRMIDDRWKGTRGQADKRTRGPQYIPYCSTDWSALVRIGPASCLSRYDVRPLVYLYLLNRFTTRLLSSHT